MTLRALRSTPSILPPNTSPIQASQPPRHPRHLLRSTNLSNQTHSRAQRKNMSATLATVDSPRVVTLPAISAFTQANETTNAPSLAAKLDVPGKITCNNSKSCSPSHLCCDFLSVHRYRTVSPWLDQPPFDFDPGWSYSTRMFRPNTSLTLSFSYRIHLSPGSRRSSSSATRAAIARAISANGSKNSRSSSVIVTPERLSSDPPSPPPALEHALLPPPPDSPPALVQAFTVSHVPVYNDSMQSGSSSSRSPTPLDNGYPMISPHSQGLTNAHIASHPSPMPSHYSDSPPTYAESSQHSSYGYVSPSSHASGTSAVDQSFDYTYGEKSPLPRLQSSALHHASMDNIHDHSPPSSAHLSSVSSRLSISHISHPQSYPTHYHAVSSPSPDSGHSMSPHSQASGPPTPNYSAYHDDRHDGATYHTIESVPDHSGLTDGYVSSQSHIIHGNYNHSMVPQQRYASPPPILAPIQDERVIRGDIRVSHVQHSPVSSIPVTPLSSSYMHSSIHNYSYHAPHISLNPATWKHDALLRGRS